MRARRNSMENGITVSVVEDTVMHNTLLPKLLSGELRVKDTAKVVTAKV